MQISCMITKEMMIFRGGKKSITDWLTKIYYMIDIFKYISYCKTNKIIS